jgi:hypothetical protein
MPPMFGNKQNISWVKFNYMWMTKLKENSGRYFNIFIKLRAKHDTTAACGFIGYTGVLHLYNLFIVTAPMFFN